MVGLLVFLVVGLLAQAWKLIEAGVNCIQVMLLDYLASIQLNPSALDTAQLLPGLLGHNNLHNISKLKNPWLAPSPSPSALRPLAPSFTLANPQPRPSRPIEVALANSNGQVDHHGTLDGIVKVIVFPVQLLEIEMNYFCRPAPGVRFWAI